MDVSDIMNFINILLAISAILTITVLYFKWAFTYWSRRKLQCIKPRIPFGNSSNYFTDPKSRTQEFLEFYQKCRKLGWSHAGVYIFTTPVYLPTDPQYIKHIMAKDFQHFTNRGAYYNERDQPIGAHLLVFGGARWKNMRVKLSPIFTSGKLKTWFPLMVECSNTMTRAMDEDLKTSEPIDAKDLCANFTTDAIATSAFGLECNSHRNSEIRRFGRLILPSSARHAAKFTFCTAFPNLARSLGLCFIDEEVEKFFDGLIRETVLNREMNNLSRNDFLQLLINLKNSEKNNITLDELIAQCFMFFIAGFEPSSTTMTFGLYELALNQEIQNKAREEVFEVSERHNGIVTYEAVKDMKYLQQVVEETLRLHPSVPFIGRQCSKPYRIPGTDVVIDEGTLVAISVLGLHQDAEYYPEPQMFNPERFSEENKKKISDYTFLPFGEGPRMCIGVRFGEVQTKIGLATMLKNYKFSLNYRTKVPLEMDLGILATVKGGVWLDVTKINS